MNEMSGFLDYPGLQKLVAEIEKILASKELPIGSIVMWSGTETPNGWALCDGQNGTPDLRGRFILGASDEYELNETGGSATHTLSISELPAHTHETAGVTVTESTTGGSLFSGGDNDMSPSESAETESTGDGEEFSILPPYYVLAYIMKLG